MATIKEMYFDIYKQPSLTPIIYGRVGDGGTQTVKIYLTEDNEVIDLKNFTITFEGNTSGNKTVIMDTDGVSNINYTEGSFSYTFPNMTFGVSGEYERAYFSITNTETKERSTTADFKIIVFDNADITAEEGITVITEYNKLIAELHELQKNNIADLQEQQDTYIQSTDNTFAAIQGRITNLQNTIKGFETSVNDTATDVLSTVNQALEELKAGDFYTQLEADARFAKTEDMSAHTENISNPHKVTKTQIGLGNVDNYSTATQAEAEAGTATNKFMTPALVFKAIAKWVQGKFVSTTGNETILGTKNFQDGITFGDGSLLPSKRKSAISKKVYSSETDPGMYANGAIELERDGNLVTCTFAFKPVNTHAHGAKIIWSLGEFEPEGIIRMPTCEGGCYLYNDPTDGNSIKIGNGLTNTQWASGTTSWIAKNRI